MTVTAGTGLFEQRQVARERMLAMTERLIAEYADLFPAGSIIRCVSRCWLLQRNADDDVDVVVATEAAVRRRLAAVLPAHGIN